MQTHINTRFTRIGVLDARGNACIDAHAVDLATELGLPLVKDIRTAMDAVLALTDRGLELRSAEPGGPGPIRVDFVHGPTAGRGRPGLGQELLTRAVGARHGHRPGIVDATAGLGRDAAMLARFGCAVTAIERSPIVAALLRDGLSRAMQNARARQVLDDRLAIVHADARNWLASLSSIQRPDVIYLDPMYAEQYGGSAAAKKEMQVLRRLLGADEDAGELFAVAIGAARQRVVVKRHQHAPTLAGEPSMTFTGRSTRFDVYLRMETGRTPDSRSG